MRKPLEPREVPAEIRDVYDYESQRRSEPVGTDRAGYVLRKTEILRTCPGCGGKDWVLVPDVRTAIKRQRLTGRCKKCATSVVPPEQDVPAYSRNRRDGRTMNEGYVLVFKPDHPHATRLGYVPEHRLVMEQTLGRFLRPHPEETVHHKNGRKDDNRPENLELWGRPQPKGVRASDPHCATCTCHERRSGQ